MASNLSFWELDPFFPAAEEVQNSTDRMESIYRAWKYTQGVAQETPEDSSIIAAVKANKRDLITALDTVRWQLEEFARAVKVATNAAAERVYLGEDAKSRHTQFVNAIQSQVCNMEKEIGDSLEKKKLKYASIGEADSKCLALFLSGSDDVDSSSPTAIAVQEREVEQGNDNDVLLDSLPSISIRIDTVDGCNGFCHHNERNGFFSSGSSSSSSSGSSSSSRDGLIESKSFWNSVAGILFWRARDHQSKMQMSASVLKRWKDGDAGFLDRAEECMSALKNRCLGRNNGRKQSSGSPRLFGLLGDHSGAVIQRRFLRASEVGDAAKIGFGALVVIGLMGLYFWFLSTLVPLDHQPVPGSFLN
ncbi:hypothetical protein SELMODRAFT_437801 [Selaginella moellendorffii]|uniref:Syntaxin 6/10/61 N-terminal domain-containing protein n=1 Tax=Selaginella moellendorffii TaxID=88036 RepID=D8QTT5_SELML|nr:uncharacterized protein LOC9629708 [Selaginella moellendorffii]EFJ36703.1 hypothetical protein SELMODRAFT_437801 [Selaginella moellendorffii]|eukprot:XP_002961443.1 uncharacterized protein LOC9629708 [Selaginella moellendorffii]